METSVCEMTAVDLLHMPYDGYRYELVRGELHKMAPAGNVHGAVAIEFAWPLAQYVRQHQLGRVYAAETGFLLAQNPDTVRAPDVAFIRRERLEAVGQIVGYWPGAPDLVVEVASPGDTRAKIAEKVNEWLDAGSEVVLVVNPRDRTVKIHRKDLNPQTLTTNDTLAIDDVVPGWRLAAADIFVD